MSEQNPLNIKEHTYDQVKGFALYVLPGLATLWIAVGTLWDLPNTAAIGGSITALATFFGVIVGVSKAQYNKLPEKPVSTDGDLLVDIHDEGQSLTVALEDIPEKLRDKDLVMFRVRRSDNKSTQE